MEKLKIRGTLHSGCRSHASNFQADTNLSKMAYEDDCRDYFEYRASIEYDDHTYLHSQDEFENDYDNDYDPDSDDDPDIAPEERIFYRGCREGNMEQIHEMITTGAIHLEKCGDSAIYNASIRGKVDIIRYLRADQRVQPGDLSHLGFRMASQEGHLGVVQALLEDSRIDPGCYRNDAIINAASYGYYEMARVLLADPRVDPTANDNMALYRSIIYGRADILRLLLADARIDPTINIRSAIDSAVYYRHVDVINVLRNDPRLHDIVEEIASCITK